MALFLGIDGGGTGCRAAIADASGQVLGRGQAGPANIASDPDTALVNILAATHAALETLRADASQLHAVLGLAGANVPDCAARLAAALPFATVRVKSDALVAVAGALQAADGIVAALGTGSVFAVQRAGNVRQIGGWGFILGDEGSGAWLGRALLAAALRATDGFATITPLLRSVLDLHGGAAGIVAFAQSARPADFATLAPQILASDDPAAEVLCARATRDIAAAIDLLQAGEALPVVFLGGLGADHAGRLQGRWPVRAPLGTGLDGALWLARQEAIA
ncbi:MAG: BadF/BadG/BcrA/BcrD ATPase family protein [Paracoccaceae bacterium]|nr:BadF/BadG/BcrA/BcrD ATPase family protein [Paracoccaceae bacterium]